MRYRREGTRVMIQQRDGRWRQLRRCRNEREAAAMVAELEAVEQPGAALVTVDTGGVAPEAPAVRTRRRKRAVQTQ